MKLKLINKKFILEVLLVFMVAFVLTAITSPANAGVTDWMSTVFEKIGGNEFLDTIFPPSFGTRFSAAGIRAVFESKIAGLDFIQAGGDVARLLGNGNPASGLLANQLLGILTLWGIIWAVIKNIATGNREMAEDVSEILVFFAMVLITLNFYQDIFVNGFVQLFEVFTQQIRPGAGTIEGTFLDIVGELFMMCVGIFAKIGSNLATINPFKFIEALLVAAPLAYAAYMTAKAAITLFITYFMGDLIAGCALAVGPFMTPFLVLDSTRSWFGAWVSLLLSSLAIKVIAILIILLAGTSLMNIVTLGASSTQAYIGGSVIADAFITVVFISTFITALEMVPMLAATLFSGGMRFNGKNASLGGDLGAKQLVKFFK